MTRRPIETSRTAELIRRHGPVAVLAAIAIAALAGLATLFLADRRADEARATAAIVATAADTARVILGEEQRLLAQFAADAATDGPDAVASTPAPGIRAVARFDPTGAPVGRWSGELADTTLAALGAEAVRAATAQPAAALLLTRAISDPRIGSMVVGLVRPYFASDGAPGGVVLVAIDRSAFAAIDRLPIVPQGGSIELLRSGGAPLFAGDERPDAAASRRAEIAGFPLAVSYRPAASDARHGLRASAAYLALAAIALIAALGLAGLMLHRQRQDKREIARLAALERQLRNELVTVAATADRSDAQSRTKSQFFAQVTHELRTPLNAILGFTQTIRQEMFGPVNNPRYLEYARLIGDAGSHLLSLINDLLDNARIEAGKMEVAPIRVSAPALARSALDLVELLAEGRDIAIAATGLAACPDLNVDPRAMKQVLVNLLSNAIKYTTMGGRIELRFGARSDGGVTIEIADTGIGMSAEDAAQAFEPFGRAASDKARRQQGTGLGLSLARALVRLHGGDLTLTSRLGAGTTATVTLPASAAFAGSGPRLLPAVKPDAAAA
jgi:signal transduction histidine kinase